MKNLNYSRIHLEFFLSKLPIGLKNGRVLIRSYKLSLMNCLTIKPARPVTNA